MAAGLKRGDRVRWTTEFTRQLYRSSRAHRAEFIGQVGTVEGLVFADPLIGPEVDVRFTHSNRCGPCSLRYGYAPEDLEVVPPDGDLRVKGRDVSMTVSRGGMHLHTFRAPARIDRMLGLIKKIWHKYPDMRLGQLLTNAMSGFEGRTYFVEDSDVEVALKRTAEKGFGP